MDRVYICIKLKNFYSTVECLERKLDQFSTNLIVVDNIFGSDKVCLDVSPKLELLGIKEDSNISDIPKELEYITIRARYKKYVEYSANIYSIYLKYISKDDIHMFSLDEAFIDITSYLKVYKKTAIEFVKIITNEIYKEFGFRVSCGIGTNLYLSKIALDILSKYSAINVGYLDEKIYKEKLWHHTPITDFWQIDEEKYFKLTKLGIKDMYDISNFSEKLLYKEFGADAEVLIDHSKGKESCTISQIKAYVPKSDSISTTQILFETLNYDKARIMLKNIIKNKSDELLKKHLVTDTIKLYIGYGSNFVKPSGGEYKLKSATNSYDELTKAFLILYDRTTNIFTPIKKIGISLDKVRVDIKLDDVANLNKERKNVS